MNIKQRISTAILFGAACLTSSSLFAQGGFAAPELALHQVNDHIYMIRSGNSGNITVLVGDEGVVLIDAKFEQDHEGVMGFIREITDGPILYEINTHLHADHTGGNALLQAQGAKVIASANARRIMTETQDTGLPNVTFDDHMRVYLDDMPIDLYYLGRGHTDGDIVIHLPDEGILLTGDLFAIWEPYVHLVHYAAGGSIRDWSRTLERALRLDFDTVIPGHSGVTDRANMEGYLAETVRMQDMVREMNRAQRSREDIQAMLESEFGWSGFMIGFGLDGVITEMQ